MKEKHIKTSDLARYILQEEDPDKLPDADQDHLIFGKIFEEVYTEYTWLYSKANVGQINTKKFMQKLASRIKSSEISKDMEEKLIKKGYKIHACLLNEDVTGRKPKSKVRKIENGRRKVHLYAQPDLIEVGKYYEFKTGPINEYAILQSEIFSWVIQEPITLVGLSESDNGYINAQREVIEGTEMDIEEKALEFVDEKIEG